MPGNLGRGMTEAHTDAAGQPLCAICGRRVERVLVLDAGSTRSDWRHIQRTEGGRRVEVDHQAVPKLTV